MSVKDYKAINVTLPPALHELLRRAAERECSTITAYVRDLLEWDLTTTPPSQRPQQECIDTIDAGGQYPKPWETMQPTD